MLGHLAPVDEPLAHAVEVAIDSRTSNSQYVEAAKQQRVWAREARLAESDA
jgi:hypothetical protein